MWQKTGKSILQKRKHICTIDAWKNIISDEGNTNQDHMRYHFTDSQMAQWRRLIMPNIGKDMDPLEFIYITGGV